MNRMDRTDGLVIKAKVVITSGWRVNAVKRVETCSLSIGGQAHSGTASNMMTLLHDIM